jgi:putative acetyltransferase
MSPQCEQVNMRELIRRLDARDHDALVEVYRQSVLCSTGELYSKQQQWAWASQSEALRPLFSQGQGFVICNQQDQAEAFCLRHPNDRIALLYSHPRVQRQGHARALLEAAQQDARREGITTLRTEASLISKPLFDALGWQVSWREELRIGGLHFLRFRMHMALGQGY